MEELFNLTLIYCQDGSKLNWFTWIHSPLQKQGTPHSTVSFSTSLMNIFQPFYRLANATACPIKWGHIHISSLSLPLTIRRVCHNTCCGQHPTNNPCPQWNISICIPAKQMLVNWDVCCQILWSGIDLSSCMSEVYLLPTSPNFQYSGSWYLTPFCARTGSDFMHPM